MNSQNNKSGKIWWGVLLIVAVIFIVLLVTGNNNFGEKISPKEFGTMIESDQVEEVYYQGGVFRIKKVGSDVNFPTYSDYYCEIATTSTQDSLISKIEAKGVDYTEKQVQESLLSTLMPYISLFVIITIAYFIFRSLMKGGQGAMGFGKSKARATANIKVRFSDVAGADEEKAELQEVVEFLKNPQKFTALGARIPKGVLLVGRPGTGKTLLAKAVAGESNVPFLSISGSDFVEMFVGVGASRVRDLFEQAKRNRPCIIFIDEIDAVGRQRGTGLGGGNDEREQTLNQLLVEMDGFEANEGIIVLAATNRSDVLDPALMRPGRFDRQIYVHAPDVKGRESIIKIHARNKPVDQDVDFKVLARITSGFTGADIENMLNEAAILAARENRPKITMTDLTEGINKVVMGPQKKSRLVTDRDKKITTYHESGHAILGKLLKNCDEVQEVSIIPRGMAAGYTMSRPSDDDNHLTYNKLNDQIAMTMGGRIAEEIVFGDISTGASNDIQQATDMARKMVTEWGMSKRLGFIGYDISAQPFLGRDYQNQSKYSEETAAIIDEEIREILSYNYERAYKLLKENRKIMDRMSELLILKETIYKDEVDMLMAGKTVKQIVKVMDAKNEELKIREEKTRKDYEYQNKILDLNKKVQSAEMLLKAGVVTQDEFEKLLESRKNLEKEYQQIKKEELEESKKQEKGTKKAASNKKTAKKIDNEKPKTKK
ncbi:MAG: ATP-dependent zinc metalloprotease FtsH [Clostridia bacterium]|nr:ATP-dependent zinc metalloprotease FtsH [Clostridia bacterium]